MTRKLLVPILILIICLEVTGLQATPRAEQRILAFQNLKMRPYDELLRGFNSTCPCDSTWIVLSERNPANFTREIQNTRPTMGLEIRVHAFSSIKQTDTVPLIYPMVSNPEAIISDKRTAMHIPPEKQRPSPMEVLQNPTTLDLLCDPDKTGHLVSRAQNSARSKAHFARTIP